MSMRVLDAFVLEQIGKTALEELLWRIRDEGRNNAKSLLRAHYVKLMREMDGAPIWGERLRKARDIVRDGFKANVTSPYRGLYALDVSLALYPYGGHHYIRTFADRVSVVGSALDFVRDLPEVSDFHFQNSTDGPKHIPEQEWKHRGNVWRAIFKSDVNNGLGNFLSVDVLTWDGFHLVDPWLELAREFNLAPPVLPSREELWAEKLASPRLTDLTFSSGRIVGKSREHGDVLIEQRGEKWFSDIGGTVREHETLDQAADHVYFEHLSESTKETVRSMVARHKQGREQDKAAP